MRSVRLKFSSEGKGITREQLCEKRRKRDVRARKMYKACQGCEDVMRLMMEAFRDDLHVYDDVERLWLQRWDGVMPVLDAGILRSVVKAI